MTINTNQYLMLFITKKFKRVNVDNAWGNMTQMNGCKVLVDVARGLEAFSGYGRNQSTS